MGYLEDYYKEKEIRESLRAPRTYSWQTPPPKPESARMPTTKPPSSNLSGVLGGNRQPAVVTPPPKPESARMPTPAPTPIYTPKPISDGLLGGNRQPADVTPAPPPYTPPDPAPVIEDEWTDNPTHWRPGEAPNQRRRRDHWVWDDERGWWDPYNTDDPWYAEGGPPVEDDGILDPWEDPDVEDETVGDEETDDTLWHGYGSDDEFWAAFVQATQTNSEPRLIARPSEPMAQTAEDYQTDYNYSSGSASAQSDQMSMLDMIMGMMGGGMGGSGVMARPGSEI